MLVLTRKYGESIVIDEKITITVERGWHGQTKLLIDAPREINVRRSELPPKETQDAQILRMELDQAEFDRLDQSALDYEQKYRKQ